MKQIVIDFETYYDKDYSLSKMQTDAYVLDPRFEVILVGVQEKGCPAEWFSGTFEETGEWLSKFDWANAAVCCHNTLFDGFIMTQKFGIKPKLWMDTLGMARHLYPWLTKFSLAALAEEFGLRAKGTAVHDMMGRRRASLDAMELMEYAMYCVGDVEITHGLCDLFLPRIDGLELQLNDMTVRMFTEPMLEGDVQLMTKLHQDEITRKELLLASAAVDKSVIMSNDKFATALANLGVAPPRKISVRTGKEAWAFAKSDKEFTELLEHPDPDVQALVSARLGVKTTIAETRALRMLETAKRGPLPVYLNYWGAKTTGRYSGGNQINWQNIPARGPSAGLRYAIRAPHGHKLVVGDSSNIELRVAMAAARQMDVVDKISQGVDLYCDFASRIFGRTITKADKTERMLGKIAMLSLQYGAGWMKFKEMVRIQSGGTIALTDTEAQGIVDLYRTVHAYIPNMWTRFERVILPEIANGNDNLIAVDDLGWCLCTNKGFGVMGAPGVAYHDLKHDGKEWTYQAGRERVKLYGGKAWENYCQYVARAIVMWQSAYINVLYPVKLSVHDEAVSVPVAQLAQDCKEYMEHCLSTAPAWCRGDIPLACEVEIGDTYGDAK